MSSNKTRTYGSAAGLIAAGLVAGGVLAGSLTANAADSTPTPSPGSSSSAPRTSGESLLTGDTLAKVKAAVLAKYAGATFDRVETDRDGVYEAHITKADGTRTTVKLDKAFTVTGEDAGHRGGRGGAGETALTGDTLAKVKAAVLAKYAGATFDRVETDRDGTYEAHITRADGTRARIALDKAYAITGEQAGPRQGGGRGHRGGPPADAPGGTGSGDNASSGMPDSSPTQAG